MSTSFILHASYVISINAGAIVSAVLNSGDVPFPLMVLLFTLWHSLFLILRLDAAFLFQNVPKIFSFLIDP